jgi:two-component system, chemotaxis family, CheB/CheR fusion protein
MQSSQQLEFHRQLRSLFAMLRTLVRQSSEGRTSVEDYAAHLEGRIGCLSRVHEMLMRPPLEGADLQELVCGEILSQAILEEQYRVNGPEIRIGRESTAALALVVHELSINAMTHGALTLPEGAIEVSWQVVRENDADWLAFDWIEHGATFHGTAPARRGFGWELFERMLPYELNARTSIEFLSAGLRARFLIPAAAAVTIWQPDSDNNKTAEGQTS